MTVREPPRPPSPRHVPADLGRSQGPPWTRLPALVALWTGVALYAALPVGCAGAAVYLLRAEDLPLLLRIVGFIVAGPAALVYLQVFLPHRLPPPADAGPLDPEQEPTAYALLDQVATEVGGRARLRFLLTSGIDLDLGGSRTLLDLLRRGRWEVTVGLWLWHGLTVSEFQAVLARSLAPLGRGRVDRARHAARAVLASLVAGQTVLARIAAGPGSAAGLARLADQAYRVGAAPVRVLGRFLLRLGTLREDALADDLAAVRVGGSDALVHAVLRADFAGASLRELDDALTAAARCGVYAGDLYAHAETAAIRAREAHNDYTLGEPPVLRGPTTGKFTDVYEPGQEYLSAMWSGLPGPVEREQNAKRTFVPCERDDRPATGLLEHLARHREQLTTRRYRELLAASRDYRPLATEVVRDWLETSGEPALPDRFQGCYDLVRRIDPGRPTERDLALLTDQWEDGRLIATARGLYSRAAERTARWRAARGGLDKVLRRTLYRPAGRERALAEDLEDDLRRVDRWLTSLDRWVYIVHVHMAARLPDLGPHDALLRRYASVLGFQGIAVDAREFRLRVAAFVGRLEAVGPPFPHRLAHDARREFRTCLDDLAALLEDAGRVDDPLLRVWTGGEPLDRFLYAHDRPPAAGGVGTLPLGRRALRAWDEVAAKAWWLHLLGVQALLGLQAEIVERFAAQAGPSRDVPDALVPDLADTEPDIDLEPEVVPETLSDG